MSKVAMFGAGMMGSAMVQRMLEHGEQVRVWNRTPAKAKALEKDGATAVADPVDTVHGADRVHIMLSDDAAVDALLDKISGAIPKGVVTIDHTTVLPKGTLARYERMQKAGIAFLHAPVFMSPQGAREGSGLILVSGPQELRDRVAGVLQKMTGKVWDLGPRLDKAAAFKLFGNQTIMFMTAALADMFALAKSVEVPPLEAYELFKHFNPSGTLVGRGAKMAAGDFTPTFELVMARKDARLMLETAEAGGIELAVLPAIAQRMDEFIARGYGDKDPGVIAMESVGA